MNINDLLNDRKRALLGSDDSEYLDLDPEYDTAMENWGDITGEEDVENVDEGSELFDEDDLQEIELEASTIDDPDEYIDNALQEFSDDSMALVGEMYIDELIAEDAIMLCESYEDLETIEEAFKDTVKEKGTKAKDQIVALAKKFAAWIKNLMGVIANLFRSGESLVNKYKSKISMEYDRRGDKIKVKTYLYKHNPGKFNNVVQSVKRAAQQMDAGYARTGGELYSSKSDRQDYMKATAKGGTAKEIKDQAIACIRSGKEKQEMTVKQIPLADILALAGKKSDYIKEIKNIDKEMQKFFKDQISGIKDTKSTAEDKEGKKAEKNMAKNRIAIAKMGANLCTAATKAYIGQLKAANRAYTAIVRKLLNQSTAGGDTETKAMKKIRNR